MNIRHRLARATSYGALLLSFSGAVFAAQLKENSADIQQIINIPGMAININPGGVGCNVVRHEKWEPTQNGCSNIEWVKQTARVISVTASPPSILANNIAASTLTATLVDGDGYLVGFGIPTSWGTSNGWLSSASTVTDASGKTAVALRGTVAGLATVTAAAVAGASAANVSLVPDASTSRVVTLTPSPASVPANGTAAALYATVRDAYNNILPAGQPVYWSTTLNSLNTGLSYTDAAGTAIASIAGATPGTAAIYARTAVSANAATNVTFTSVVTVPTITSITATASNIYDSAGTASRVSWAGTNLTGATTYTIVVTDAGAGGYIDGPSVFYPTAGSTGWWLNTRGQMAATGTNEIPYAGRGPARVTLTACNGGSCSSASTTYDTNWHPGGG